MIMKSKRIYTFLLGSLIAMSCMANVHPIEMQRFSPDFCRTVS